MLCLGGDLYLLEIIPPLLFSCLPQFSIPLAKAFFYLPTMLPQEY